MERPTESIKKLLECISHDTCENEGCEYWNNLSDIEAVTEYIEFLESELGSSENIGNTP